MCVCACMYLTIQLFHCNQIQGFERVSCGGYEIKADVDPGVVVVKQRALDLQLLLKIVFKLSINIVNDGLVAVERTKKNPL